MIQDGMEAESRRWNLQGEIRGKSSHQKDCRGFQHGVRPGVHVVDSVTLCSVRQLVVVVMLLSSPVHTLSDAS
jgi:hypothetical protein